MTTVDMLEAKTSLSRLVDAVESGAESEIIIARNGKPAAKLVPLDANSRPRVRLGLHDGEYPPMSLEDFNSTDAEIAKLFGSKKIEAPAGYTCGDLGSGGSATITWRSVR